MFESSSAFTIRDQRLFVDECDAVKIAQEFGTPVFVVSETQLRKNAKRIRKAFQDEWPEGTVEVYPAFKAAPYLAVRKILSNEGYGCDTFGESELEGAIRGGTDPSKISVNGSLKTRAVIARGIEIGARIVIDAPREVDLCIQEAERQGKTARIMLRLKPDLSGLEIDSDFVPMPVGAVTQRIRYGLPYEEALAAAEATVASPELELIGFHCHIGRQSTDLSLWAGLVEHMLDLAVEICQSVGLEGWRPGYLDFGGGFAPPRDFDTDGPRTGDTPPTIEDYARAMMTTLRKGLAKHNLDGEGLVVEVEPGRSLHSDTGIHLTTIKNIKRSAKHGKHVWAEMDTSELFLGTFASDPSTRLFNYVIANKPDSPATEVWDLVGKSCNGEMILLDADVPELATDDVVALLDTGAYIESLGCNFNAMPRPGTVLVSKTQKSWIRKPESVEQVYARDVIPNWA